MEGGATEAAHIMAVLATETSAMMWDSAAFHLRDAKRDTFERVSRMEVENTAVLASACEDVESLVWKVTLLKGELAEVHKAREVAEENSRGLFDAVADAT
jgi:hypothetical protein